MGGSFSSGSSSQQSQQSSNIAPEQLPFLQNLWRSAQKQFEQQPGRQVQDASQGLVDEVSPGARQGFDQALGAGDRLSPFTDPNNELAQEQIDLATGDINRNLTENILPGLTSSAIGGGNLGGSRGALAAGQAAAGTQRAVGQATTAIRSNTYNQAVGAAGTAGALDIEGGRTAIAGAGQLVNLGLSPFNAAWGPLQQFASILGRPTVLSQGSSEGSSSSFGFGF